MYHKDCVMFSHRGCKVPHSHPSLLSHPSFFNLQSDLFSVIREGFLVHNTPHHKGKLSYCKEMRRACLKRVQIVVCLSKSMASDLTNCL